MLGGKDRPPAWATAVPGRASNTRVPIDVEKATIQVLTMWFSPWAGHPPFLDDPGGHGDAPNQDDTRVHEMCRSFVAGRRGASIEEDLSPCVVKPRRLHPDGEKEDYWA